jgi:hypothetical protein
LSKKGIADLNERFSDMLRTGEIVKGVALRQEKDKPEIWDLPRLILTPNRRSFARFRQLINSVNSSSIR